MRKKLGYCRKKISRTTLKIMLIGINWVLHKWKNFFYGNTWKIPWEHTTSNPKIIENLFITQSQHQQLKHTLWNGGRTNLSEWPEQIVDDFCEEQAIDKRASFNNIKSLFHEDFHKSFLCTIPTLLFKFLIDKGIAHIVEPQPPLVDLWSNNNRERIKRWQTFIKNQEWK